MYQKPKPILASLRVTALSAAALAASFAPQLHAQHTVEGAPAVSLGLTYAAARSNHVDQNSFWLQGGALDLNARFYHGLGLGASGTGLTVRSNSPLAAPLDLVTITFGPTYTFHAGHRVSLYSEALLGEAHGFHSLFAYGSGPANSLTAGTTDSANALALQTGGALDLNLSRHLAVRAVQVDYLRTELPNGFTNVQNNLRLAAGLVMRFGR